MSKVVEFSPPRPWRWRWHGEEDPRETRKWLVQDLLPETGAGLIAGQWGTYKTFVALDLAATVMTKATFIKFPVRRQGGVLFFACEGQSEIAIRLAAVVETKCGGLDKAPFAWVDTCPRLLDPTAGKILADMVKDAADKMIKDFGLPVALVIIDTAGKAAGYAKSGDENDAALGKIMMKALAVASTETGALFLAVDHFGKDASVGTRGTSGKEDDADVVLALLGEKGIGEEQKAAARQKAFKRAVKDAQERGLIGLRVVDGVTFIWLATAQEGPTNA